MILEVQEPFLEYVKESKIQELLIISFHLPFSIPPGDSGRVMGSWASSFIFISLFYSKDACCLSIPPTLRSRPAKTLERVRFKETAVWARASDCGLRHTEYEFAGARLVAPCNSVILFYHSSNSYVIIVHCLWVRPYPAVDLDAILDRIERMQLSYELCLE